MHIKKFLDEDYTDYAVYRIYQRLPHILDSLGQTQRKILYVLEKLPEAKKVKTAEVYSHVYSGTQYLHGDASVYTVVENMARACSNNLNLLTEEGSFGYRTDKSAASPRYTSTRFSKLARLIFPDADKPIYDGQEFEGKAIEPKNMLPILPINLVSGYNAIAVGFASKFLPRNPNQVIDAIIETLKYKKRKTTTRLKWEQYRCPDVTPAFPHYTGQVVHDIEHESKSAWYLTGALHKTKRRNVIVITDLPPEASRESYIKKLKKLVDRGVIREYKEECVKNTFKVTVKVSNDIWKQSEDQLMQTLGLVDKVVENFTFLNPFGSSEDTVIKFQDANEYLKHFVELRQDYYVTRKMYQLDKLQQEVLVLKERIKFINDVNAGDIIITKRKKIDLEKELKSKDFNLIDGTFDHLLGMRMYALTEENVLKFERHIKDREKDRATLEKTSPEDLHINELLVLQKAQQAELKTKGIE